MCNVSVVYFCRTSGEIPMFLQLDVFFVFVFCFLLVRVNFISPNNFYSVSWTLPIKDPESHSKQDVSKGFLIFLFRSHANSTNLPAPPIIQH